MRHVTAVVDNAQLGIGDLLVKTLGETKRNQFIVAAPDDERRFMDRTEPAVQDIFIAHHRIENLIDRVAVAGGHALLECKIDIFIEALVVKCQRPEISNVIATGQAQRAQRARIHVFA